MLPEHWGQLAVGIAGADERRSNSHTMTANMISMRKPGMNQLPMCHPLQADPGPQNMFNLLGPGMAAAPVMGVRVIVVRGMVTVIAPAAPVTTAGQRQR